MRIPRLLGTFDYQHEQCTICSVLFETELSEIPALLCARSVLFETKAKGKTDLARLPSLTALANAVYFEETGPDTEAETAAIAEAFRFAVENGGLTFVTQEGQRVRQT